MGLAVAVAVLLLLLLCPSPSGCYRSCREDTPAATAVGLPATLLLLVVVLLLLPSAQGPTQSHRQQQ
jgi:hypothetical protein